ncbi:MAG TPA: hypothetical protein VI636_00595 [Candidatus Angelobacter sp.]
MAKPKISINTLHRRGRKGRRGNLAKLVQLCYNPRQMKKSQVLAASSWLLAKPKINVNILHRRGRKGNLLSWCNAVTTHAN